MSIYRREGMTDAEYLGFLCMRYESATTLEKLEIENIIAQMAGSEQDIEKEPILN